MPTWNSVFILVRSITDSRNATNTLCAKWRYQVKQNVSISNSSTLLIYKIAVANVSCT